jgi:hypothetical protein
MLSGQPSQTGEDIAYGEDGEGSEAKTAVEPEVDGCMTCGDAKPIYAGSPGDYQCRDCYEDLGSVDAPIGL